MGKLRAWFGADLDCPNYLEFCSGGDGTVMVGNRKGSRGRSRKGSALEVLGPVELAGVLKELLRRRPELRAEADRIAREMLSDAEPEAVADEIEWELRSLPSDELNGRAGRQPGRYVEPTEAAWELLGEVVETYDREVERLLALGMIEAATDTALGVIAGLYRCRDCNDGEQLLSWAPDFALEHASCVVSDLAKAGIELPHEFVADAAPEWTDSLARAKGRDG